MNKTLIIVEGLDRVGKSTLQTQLVAYFNGFAGVKAANKHFGAPSHKAAHPYDMYREALDDFESDANDVMVWDRSFISGRVYDVFRRSMDTAHDDERLQLELDILASGIDVAVILVTRPWYWSVGLHLQEVQKMHPNSESWHLVELLSSRRREHELGQQMFIEYLQHKCCFPSVILDNPPEFDFATLELLWDRVADVLEHQPK